VRRPATFWITFALATMLTIAPEARAQGVAEIRYEAFAEDEKAIVDRIAADFYEEDLRPSQSEAIERRTSEIYLEAGAEERERMREERRAEWTAMSEAARASLMEAKSPLYGNLTDAQKAPFRRHAIDRLTAAGAVDEAALEDAINSGI